MEEDLTKLFEKGVVLIKKGHPKDAVECFEKLLNAGDKSSASYSWLGLALARSGGDLSRAEALCLKAIKKDFYWPHYYLNLAEVYLIRGKKSKAIRALEEGLRIDRNNKAILNELERLGIRKNPPIPFLSRANPINKYIGIILSQIGFRS